MAKRRLGTYGATTKALAFLLACALLALPLAGCKDASPSNSPTEPVVGGVTDVAASDEADDSSSSDTSAPTIATTSPVFPAMFFQVLEVEDPVATLESLGCTDISDNEDGSYSASVSAEDYTHIAEMLYRYVKDDIDMVPGSEEFPEVVSVSYDETFATVVIALNCDELPEEIAKLVRNVGDVVLMYQSLANLPQECDVMVLASDGSELSSTFFPVSAA